MLGIYKVHFSHVLPPGFLIALSIGSIVGGSEVAGSEELSGSGSYWQLLMLFRAAMAVRMLLDLSTSVIVSMLMTSLVCPELLL